MYKISIIIPVFNVEETLQNAFDSILKQTIGFSNLEVIFVDDKSTDNSTNIIKEFAKKYNNVKAIFLENNSGFAGKPRNVGIKNSTADYLMFLDPDDIFLEEACEILYNNITKNQLEIVSGNYNIKRNSKIIQNNWDLINLKNGESSQIESIKENFNFILTPPSVWSKIFKKDFIIKENIEFLEGVPAQDLVFVSEALLKANGIKFINNIVVEYSPRENENKSVTSKKTKEVLSGFIKSYTELYNIAYNYNKEFSWIGPRNLFFWIKQFTLSDLSISDKIDLLNMSNFLFEELIKSTKIKPPEFLEYFLELISKKDFLNASLLSEKLGVFYDEKQLMKNINDKEIFLLFYGLDIEIGGLAKATFNRANLLKQNQYNVTLLNLNKSKNFDYIIDNFHKRGYLNNSINVINIIEYYALKNTLNKHESYKHKIIGNYEIKKSETKDKTIKFDYYTRDSEKLIQSELYFNKYSCINSYDSETQLITEKFYTNDGFNFLTISHENNNELCILNDMKTNIPIKFENIFAFHNHFMNEILLECENKPFLINENSGKIPNFNNINPNLAYKIASIHTNPYRGEYHYGSPLRKNFSILENTAELDYIVVLTETLKMDLIKEFNVPHIESIPNIINISKYPSKNYVKKQSNKFSIFARLSPEKNISDAIKAFEIVVQNRNDAILEIFGRASTSEELKEEKKLKSLVKKRNLERNITFKGHVENVNKEMSKSLATLFVSDFEGLGMVVLESMLNSTPVISYDINYGPSDFIIHGQNGYLIKQNDKSSLAKHMIKLLDNPLKAYEMGKNAHNHILTQLESEKLFLKWETVFKEAYINSLKRDINHTYEKESKLLNEIEKLEKIRVRLYRENDKLYKENKHLKKQFEETNKNTLKNIFGKLKF